MLKAYPVIGKDKSRVLCEAFIAGAPHDAEGAVFFGVNETNVEAWRRAKASGLPWFYGDNAFFDATRGKRFRWAKNRVQIDASLLRSKGTRFDQLGLKILPWRHNPDGYWLKVEQSASFMRTVSGEPNWLRDWHAYGDTGRPVVLRTWNRDKRLQATTLARDIAGAYAMVTHSSAAAVQAVRLGIPAYVSGGCALAGMVCSTDPAQDDRRRILSVLADHEFNLHELKEGAAWRRLHP